MIILVKPKTNGASGVTITYKQYFQENELLPCGSTLNWDDIVDNIKDVKVRTKVVMSGCLMGGEYPDDTPITEKEGDDGEWR
tara:strand:+ start:1450 stop:1695 length:246 start_codon:yes stop_codon:yes gene_type:complete